MQATFQRYQIPHLQRVNGKWRFVVGTAAAPFAGVQTIIFYHVLTWHGVQRVKHWAFA